MIVNFDLDKLGDLLEDFYKITGITVSIWDADFNQLAFRPKVMPEFCRLIKTTENGNRQCLESDILVCKRAYAERKPVTHKCHVGLFDTAAPIIFEDKLLGFVMFGQISDKNEARLTAEELAKLCRDIPIDPDILYKAYSELNMLDSDKISAASHIMVACINYLWLFEMIKLEQNILATKIDGYIKENLAQKLSVEGLCDKFNISKNKLYALCSAHFGHPVTQYITKLRIKQAQSLLITTDEPIYIICEKVGIPDYNYFSKVFKKETAVSPHTYRKFFPLMYQKPK